MDTRPNSDYDTTWESNRIRTVVRAPEEEPNRMPDAVPSEDPEGSGRVSLDLVFGILKNSRRRRVIHYLRRHGEQVSVSDLAEHIASIENDTEPAMLSSKQRKRVYVGLYQCHLPKMDDAGVIEYNKDRGTVELGDRAAVFKTHLESALDLGAADDSTGTDPVRTGGERTDPAPVEERTDGARATGTPERELETLPDPDTPDRGRYLLLGTVVGAIALVIRRLLPHRDEPEPGEPIEWSDGGTQWAVGPKTRRK